jgi:ABC-type transport system involved in multi-copper enzyme maturation permease subunit
LFRWEVAAIARRKWTYVIRWVYGLVILICFSLPLIGTSGLSSAQELEHRKLAEASLVSFGALVVGQATALFLVTPALFAGAIALEVERGNLVLLLASPVKSLEIVLGKLGPRMAQVALILAVAVPVLGLLSLNGGVDEKLVVLSDGVLFTSAFLIASLAMLVSSMSASVRLAALWTYVAVIAWLLAPFILDGLADIVPVALHEPVGAAGDLFSLTNPVSVLSELTTLPPTLMADFLKTMLVQVGVGLSLVAITGALLRPMAKRAGPFGWRLAPVSFLLSRRRLLPRPACGIRPVLWKEMHVARSRVLTRLFLALVVLAILVPLGWATWDLAARAFRELWTAGYGSEKLMAERQELNLFLRVTNVMISMISVIGLAVSCSTSITHEKEKDSWTSLVGTPLDVWEIVGQKTIGAFWRLRWPGLLYVCLLALGIAAGAIHPLGAILNVVQLTAFLGFVAGLATYLSLQCRSSIRALGWTFFSLFLLNGGYLLGCVLVQNPHPVVVFLVTPLMLTISLATYSEVDWFLRNCGGPGTANDAAWLIVMNAITYGVAAIVLWLSCGREFDKAAGRPIRNGVAGRTRAPKSQGASRRVGKPLREELLPETD